MFRDRLFDVLINHCTRATTATTSTSRIFHLFFHGFTFYSE